MIDTGLGVPASKQKIIFKEFQRLEQGAKVARGLGLGLSIVERIARVLDHKVTLRSAPAKGSTFAVEVPVATGVPAVHPCARSSCAGHAARRRGRAVHRKRAAGAGRHGGAAVRLGLPRARGPGLAALAASESGPRPDALLVDYHLDEGNGIDAIVACASNSATAFRQRYHRRPSPAVRERRARRNPGLQQAGKAGGAARFSGAVARGAAGGRIASPLS